MEPPHESTAPPYSMAGALPRATALGLVLGELVCHDPMDAIYPAASANAASLSQGRTLLGDALLSCVPVSLPLK